MNKQDMYLLEAFKSLGKVINHKDTEISLLKYENEKLKDKIKQIEEHIESYIKEE